MKKITAMTFGLVLLASPAFAQVVVASGSVQGSAAEVDQSNVLNDTGNTLGTYSTDSAGNGGVSQVGVNNSAGVINQNVNTGATSNVGSSTNVAINAISVRGGNFDAGNPNDTTTQVSDATLSQVNAYNATGDAFCYGSNTSTYTAGVSNVGVAGSQGVISQQVNAGVSSNVGSANNISIR